MDRFRLCCFATDRTIPQLFHYDALLLVSNGVQSKIGSLTAEWEHFGDWKKATSEGDVAEISLETLLRGTCEKGRLLDLIENFTRFVDDKGRTSKLLARNHQFHGVNSAISVLAGLCDPQITLTPTLSQKEWGQEAPHYRGGFQFAGMVKRARELRQTQTPAEDEELAARRHEHDLRRDAAATMVLALESLAKKRLRIWAWEGIPPE